jgi:hypothetical protein
MYLEVLVDFLEEGADPERKEDEEDDKGFVVREVLRAFVVIADVWDGS